MSMQEASPEKEAKYKREMSHQRMGTDRYSDPLSNVKEKCGA
jgi:hypothetical protein